MRSYPRKMPSRMYSPSNCNHLEPRPWPENLRGEKSIHYRPETDFYGMHVNAILVRDGRSADGWVHEVGMYADVAIVWQGPTVSSVRVVGAPD